MAGHACPATLGLEVMRDRIGIAGTLILLPIAVVGLLVGFVRFAFALVVALEDKLLETLGGR